MCPLPKTGGSHSIHKTRGSAPQILEIDENEDNGRRHPRKNTVCLAGQGQTHHGLGVWGGRTQTMLVLFGDLGVGEVGLDVWALRNV